MEEEFEMEEQQFLNLSLSLVSRTTNFGHVHQNKVIIDHCDQLPTSSDGSSDGGECTYEILRLLEIRHRMLIQDQANRDSRTNGNGLIHLLLKAASSMDERGGHHSAAISNLIKLYESASLVGDSVQRLGAHYADGLTARVLKQSRTSPDLYRTIMKESSQGDKLMAFTHMYKVSPCYQFSHFTANQSILEAFERELPYNGSQLHVLDMDLAFGLQWPSLIQSLSEKATPKNPVSFRITGLGSSLEEVRETEARLVSFAESFHNLTFDFQGLVRGSSRIFEHSVFTRSNNQETVAVNLVLSSFNTCSSLSPWKISDTLRLIRSINPSIIAVVQRERVGDDRMESLFHYYAAMFGSLEDCLPRESSERASIERDHLGMEMKREMVMEREEDKTLMSWARYEGLGRWKERMEEFGFEGVEMSTRASMQAKLLLRMRSHGCQQQFRVVERESGKAISLAWQDRLLMTATAWRWRSTCVSSH